MRNRNKVLGAVLAIVMLGALGVLCYILAAPPAGERYTEFYILGMEGKAVNYPAKLVVGKEGRVIVNDILLNTICFSPLYFSPFAPIARLGWIMGVMIISCGFGALVIMPSFLRYAVRKEG